MDTRERATMGKGMPNMEAPMDPFGRIMDLECELATLRALVELDILEKQNIINALCNSTNN
jgi:hypothetical protein